MTYCTKCGNQITQEAKFCNQCGAPVAPAEAVYAQPVQVITAVPEVSVKDKVLGFVGMGLGIFGLIMAIIGLLCSVGAMEEEGVGFFFSMYFGLFSVPMGFVGRALSKKSAEGGNTSRACSVGSGLALAAIIVSFVMLFFGIINLAV